MKFNKTTTRKQLQGYGATLHHARAVTQSLSPITTQGRSYAYLVSDVITSIREYLQRPRLKEVTQAQLEAVLKALLQRLDNVVEIPFAQSVNPEISKLTKRLIQTMNNTDQALTELRATAATIKGKHSSKSHSD